MLGTIVTRKLRSNGVDLTSPGSGRDINSLSNDTPSTVDLNNSMISPHRGLELEVLSRSMQNMDNLGLSAEFLDDVVWDWEGFGLGLPLPDPR